MTCVGEESVIDGPNLTLTIGFWSDRRTQNEHIPYRLYGQHGKQWESDVQSKKKIDERRFFSPNGRVPIDLRPYRGTRRTNSTLIVPSRLLERGWSWSIFFPLIFASRWQTWLGLGNNVDSLSLYQCPSRRAFMTSSVRLSSISGTQFSRREEFTGAEKLIQGPRNGIESRQQVAKKRKFSNDCFMMHLSLITTRYKKLGKKLCGLPPISVVFNDRMTQLDQFQFWCSRS